MTAPKSINKFRGNLNLYFMEPVESSLLAAELLNVLWRSSMICPRCASENEIAYSVISNGLICLECSFEQEMDASAAHQILETQEELVCC